MVNTSFTMPLNRLHSDFSTYLWIRRELSLPLFRDALSPLMGMLIFKPRTDWNTINEIIGEKAIVVGAGPSLIPGIHELLSTNFDDYTILCADGSVSVLLENKILPDVVVTDLDGCPRALVEAYNRGSIFIVLCHGDNIDKQLYFKDRIVNVYLTSQVISFPPFILNLGGFTDGDRAVHIAARFGAKDMILVGMDFSPVIGRHSIGFRKDLEFKRRKLRIGKILVKRARKIYGLNIKYLI